MTALLPNPHVRVGLEREGAEVARIHLAAPVRGRGMITSIVDRAKDSALFGIASAFLLRPDLDLVDETEREALARLGLLIEPHQCSEPVRFECFLDEAAERSPAPESSTMITAEGLVVNPALYVQDVGSPIPAPLEGRVHFEDTFWWGSADQWFLPAPRVWIDEPRTGVVAVYGLRGPLVALVRALVPGATPPPALDAATAATLCATRVLVPQGEHARRLAAREALTRAAHQHFLTEGFVSIESLVEPAQLRALQAFYRRFTAQGHAHVDRAVDNSFGAYNEGVARLLHFQLNDLASRVFGMATRPSYVYFRQYGAGAVLPEHVDERESSALSISFLVDFSPQDGPRSPWPLCLAPVGRPVIQVFQAPGDGVFYRGTEMPHFRDALPAGQTSTSLFFEYVPASYQGSLI